MLQGLAEADRKATRAKNSPETARFGTGAPDRGETSGERLGEGIKEPCNLKPHPGLAGLDRRQWVRALPR